jgi:hypothetical protein
MTLSPSDWELLHRELDGETTPSEKAALERRKAHEPELAACDRALLAVDRRLAEVGLVDPPPELARDVMRQVARRPLAPQGWLPGLTGWVARKPALALAASLAIGLLGGLLVTSLSGRGLLPRLDEGSVSGTLLPPGHLATLPVIDEAHLAGPGVRGTARTRRGPEGVVAELTIASEGPVDVTVEVDESVLRPRGFECPAGEPAGGVVVEPGRVELRRVPAGQCFVSLAVQGAGPATIAVHLQAGAGRAEATLRAEGFDE